VRVRGCAFAAGAGFNHVLIAAPAINHFPRGFAAASAPLSMAR
jgi:hypothetical protein